jgi:hypothetical protein
MVRRQRFPKRPSRACILVLGLRGSFVFRLPPYNPSGERMAAISWNPTSFCLVIFLFLFPLEFLGLAWELHDEILKVGWMIGRRGSSRLDCVSPVSPLGDFRSLFLAILLWRLWDISCWYLVGDVCMNPSWFFSLWSPTKSVSKGARCWCFLLSRVRGVIGEISSIPLDLASFGGPNHDYGMPMRHSYYPQSLLRIRGANREIKIWIWWSWPAARSSWAA